MPRESYAATVTRHVAVIEELFMTMLEQLPPGDRTKVLRPLAVSLHEIEKATKQRIEASDYEAQRRDGKHLVTLAHIGYQRRGEAS